MPDTLLVQNAGTAGLTADTAIYGTRWRAQTFTTPYTCIVTGVSLKLKRTTSPPWSGSVAIFALDVVTHKPTGAALGGALFFTDESAPLFSGQQYIGVPTVFSFVYVPFNAGYVSLSGGIEYALVLSCDGANSTHALFWQKSTTAFAGNTTYSPDAGGSWGALDSSPDHPFEIYGEANSSVWIEGSQGLSLGGAGDISLSTLAIDGTGGFALGGTIYTSGTTDISGTGGFSLGGQCLLYFSSLQIVGDGTGFSLGGSCDIDKTGLIWLGGSGGFSLCGHLAPTYSGSYGDSIVRMIPFVYSRDVRYMLEFGGGYVRVFYEGAPLMDGGSHVEAATPYTHDDLYAIQYKQIGDVMWLVHPDYPPYKLSRTSVTTFTVTAVTFNRGPFLTRNDLDDTKDQTIAMSCDVVDAGETGLMTANKSAFVAGHVGALFDLTHPSINQEVVATATAGTSCYSPVLMVQGSYTFTVKDVSAFTGSATLQKSTDGVGWANVQGPYTTHRKVTDTETVADTQYRIYSVCATGKLESVLTQNSNVVTGKFTGTKTGISGATEDDPQAGAIDIKGDFQFDVDGSWGGVVVLERNENDAGWEDFRTWVSVYPPGKQVQFAGVETENNVQYRARITQHDRGTVTVTLRPENSVKTGIVRVTAVHSGTEVAVTVVAKLATTTETKRWSEGAWSIRRGFPAAIGFHDGRIVYAATNMDAQTLWFSHSDQYENFEEGTKDADSFSLRLMTMNSIRWVSGLSSLVACTSGGVWSVQSDKMGSPITPTNFGAREQNTFGTAALQPHKSGGVVLYVDEVGRKVRELAYMWDKDQYAAQDMTSLAEHVTAGGIINTAYQQNPDQILWCVLADGSLVSMTYERDQNVIAWAKHPIAGKVLSVAVMPGDDEDEVWLSVKRTVVGVESIFIERFAARVFAGSSSAYFVDSGIVNTSGTTAISGLGHLEGATVSMLADGVYVGDQVVAGGAIALASPAGTVAVGLPYTSIVEPMRIDLPMAAGGTTQTITKRIPALSINVYQTSGIQYGYAEDSLLDVPFEGAGLYTGEVPLAFDGGFNTDDALLIVQSAPLPCVIRSIIPRVEQTSG